MIEFLLLNLSFFTLLLTIVLFKEFTTSVFVLWFGTIISTYTPSLYIFFGGESYRTFSDESAQTFYLLSSVSIVFICLTLLIIKFLTPKYDLNTSSFTNYSVWLKASLVGVFFLCYLYIFYYINDWPIFSILAGDMAERPDVVKGGFKGYFTFSMLAQIVLPSLFFIYKDYFFSSRFKFISGVVFFSVPLVIGGNKGILLYFFIFLFLYSPLKINFSKLLFVFFLLILFYALMKSSSVDGGLTLSYLFESILKRVFVTQGMSAPTLIELVNQGYNISGMGSNELKYYIFYRVYGYSPGSMPIFYTFEIFSRFGIFSLIILGWLVSFIVAFVIVLTRSSKSLAIKWVCYYSLYGLVMGGVSDANLIRYSFSIVFVIFIFLGSGLCRGKANCSVQS